MSSVTCQYCGEVYLQSEERCPLCGAPNDNIVREQVESAAAPMAGDTIECECCGDNYDSSLKQCPMCGMENPMYLGSDPSYEEQASYEDEYQDEEVYQTPQPRRKENVPQQKQAAPSTMLVLFSFVGIIIIIITMFVSCASSVASKQSSKIGMELFDRQEMYYNQND